MAKKYYVDFALKKDTAAELPRYLVSFSRAGTRTPSRRPSKSLPAAGWTGRENLPFGTGWSRRRNRRNGNRSTGHWTGRKSKPGIGACSDEHKKLILTNLPYLLFGYPFDNLAQAFRLAPGADLSAKLLSIQDRFSMAFASPAPSLEPTDLLIGVAGGLLLRLAVYMRGKNTKKYRHGMEYGSARWSA